MRFGINQASSNVNVFVGSDGHNKNTPDWAAYITEMHFSQSGGWKSKIKVLTG